MLHWLAQIVSECCSSLCCRWGEALRQYLTCHHYILSRNMKSWNKRRSDLVRLELSSKWVHNTKHFIIHRGWMFRPNDIYRSITIDRHHVTLSYGENLHAITIEPLRRYILQTVAIKTFFIFSDTLPLVTKSISWIRIYLHGKPVVL